MGYFHNAIELITKLNFAEVVKAQLSVLKVVPESLVLFDADSNTDEAIAAAEYDAIAKEA
jgi:hypothetical protein